MVQPRHAEIDEEAQRKIQMPEEGPELRIPLGKRSVPRTDRQADRILDDGIQAEGASEAEAIELQVYRDPGAHTEASPLQRVDEPASVCVSGERGPQSGVDAKGGAQDAIPQVGELRRHPSVVPALVNHHQRAVGLTGMNLFAASLEALSARAGARGERGHARP